MNRLGFLLFILMHLMAPLSASALTLAEVRKDPSSLLLASPNQIKELAAVVHGDNELTPNQRSEVGKRLQNLATVKEKLEKCFGDVDDARGLKNAILAGTVADPCLSHLTGVAAPLNVAEDISEILNATNFQQIRGFLSRRVLGNAARTIYDYRARFEGAQKLPPFKNPSAMFAFVRKVCHFCNKQQAEVFKDAYLARARSAQPVRADEKFSIDQILLGQNQTIDGLNTRIEKMIDAKRLGQDAKFQEEYQGYLDSYRGFTATQIGAVFLTDAIREKVGRPLNPEDIEKKFLIAGDVQAPQHQSLRYDPIGRQTVSRALDEIELKVAGHARAVLEAENFMDLLKTDPAMIGQILVVNPSLFATVCASIKELTTSDANKKEFVDTASKVVEYADYASLGLMVTGAGGIAAKSITLLGRTAVAAGRQSLMKSLVSAAGKQALVEAASAGRAAQIMRSSALLGAVAEAGHVAVDGGQLYMASQQQDMLVASRMARARGNVDIQRMNELESKWNSAMLNFSTGTAMNALPMARGLAQALMKVRAGRLIANTEKRADAVAREMAHDERFLEVVNAIGADELNQMAEAAQRAGASPTVIATALAAAAKDGKVVEQIRSIVAREGAVPPDLTMKLVAAVEEAKQCMP